MTWKPCPHKTIEDHKVKMGEHFYWVCTNCGEYGRWNVKWSYWGSYECRKCQTAAIDWVACSDKCAERLMRGKDG